MEYQITQMSAGFLSKARAEGVDDQGQEVKRLVAAGGEPCRDVFRRARPGEALILASHCPFQTAGPYREYGPVFILANESAEPPPLALPVRAGEGSEPYLRESFVLRAYNGAEEIVGASLVTPDTANQKIAEMFSDANVRFIHARFPTYGCYALRLDRTASGGPKSQ